MIKKILLIFLFSVIGLSLFACSKAESILPPDSGDPILPSEIAQKIQSNIGYAIAPTWMLEGFEFRDPSIDDSLSYQPYSGQRIYQLYEVELTEEVIGLIMSYPYSVPISVSFSVEDRLGIERPHDELSEVKINDNKAYLVKGTWTDETAIKIGRLEKPDNPEWDYEKCIAIMFTIEVPDGERVGVRISVNTVFPLGADVDITDRVSDDDLIRIAKSVVVID